MGCTASSSMFKVTYLSETKQTKVNLPTYAAARAWITSQFSELHQQPYRLQTFQVPPVIIKNTQDYVSVFNRYQGELHLQVVLEKTQKYKYEILKKLSPSIFKIRRGLEDIEATGFMLSPRFCLLGINKNIHNYHALFEDGTSLLFKKDGIMISVGEFSIAELEITPQWATKTLGRDAITLDTNYNYDHAVLLYYSTSRTVIQEYTGEYAIENQKVCFNAKEVSLSTPGAPVFSSNGKVFAIYTKNGIAETASNIIKNLAQQIEFLDISYQEAIEESLMLSNVFNYKIKTEKENWDTMSGFINTGNSSLILIQDNEIKSYGGMDAKEGSSMAYTPLGIIITGSDNLGSKKKAWIFNGNSIESLPDLKQKHVNHSSLYFENKVYVISGKYNSYVEALDLQTKNWIEVCNLSSKRAFTSLIISNNCLYLFGGVKSKKRISRSIWKFVDNTFEKCSFKLPEKILAPGIILFKSSHVIVFGGMVSDDEYNKKVWEISLDDGMINDSEPFDISMTFGVYPTTKSNKGIILYSNRGEIILYDKSLEILTSS